MRFMMLMIPGGGYETANAAAMPDAKAVEAMMKYNEQLQKAGTGVFCEQKLSGPRTLCSRSVGRLL